MGMRESLGRGPWKQANRRRLKCQNDGSRQLKNLCMTSLSDIQKQRHKFVKDCRLNGNAEHGSVLTKTGICSLSTIFRKLTE